MVLLQKMFRTCGTMPSPEYNEQASTAIDNDRSQDQDQDNDHDFNAECENICGDDSLMELVKIADFKILTTNVQTPNPPARPLSGSKSSHGLFTACTSESSTVSTYQKTNSSAFSSLDTVSDLIAQSSSQSLSITQSPTIIFSTDPPNATPLDLNENDQQLMEMSWSDLHTMFRYKYGQSGREKFSPDREDINILERMMHLSHPDRNHKHMLEWGKSLHNRQLTIFLQADESADNLNVSRSASDRCVRADASMEKAIFAAATQSGSNLDSLRSGSNTISKGKPTDKACAKKNSRRS